MISANINRYTFESEVAERTTPTIKVTLLDENGVGVPDTALDSLLFTLFNDKTGAIVNSRDHVSVLNANGGSVSNAGVLTLALTALDTAIVDATRTTELRVALIEWNWTINTVPKSGKAEVAFVVRNLQRVPA